MTKQSIIYFVLLIAMLIGVASCQRDHPSTSVADVGVSSTPTVEATREPSPTSTMTLQPTATQTASPSPVPTETPVPTATPTATALPFPDQPITVDNAHLIEPLVTHGKGTIWDFDLSPEGSLLAVAASTGLYLYDAASMDEIGRLKTGLATDVAFSPDGELLATTISSEDTATVFVIGVDDDEEIVHVPVDDFGFWAQLVNHIEFDSNSSVLMVRERETIRFWEIPSGQELHTLEVGRTNLLRDGRGRWSLALSQKGRWLTSAHDGTMKLTVWDVEDNYESATLDLQASPYPIPIAFSPDERLLAVGFGTGAAQETQAMVEIWDLEDRALLQTLSGHRHAVSALAFSPDGHLMAAGSQDGIRIWDLDQGKVVHHLDAEREPVFSYVGLEFSANGELLFSSAREQGGVSVWNLEAGEIIDSLSEFTTLIHAATFAPTGEKVVLRFDDDSIRFIDLVTGQEGPVLNGGASPLGNDITVSPDGRLLAAGVGEFGSQEVVVWELNSKEIVARLPVSYSYVSDLLFSPDGRFLLSYDDDYYTIEADLWDTSTWQNVGQHRVTRDSYDFRKQEFYFTVDATWLVAALEERLELWNPFVPGSRRSLYEETGTKILDVAMFPNGNNMAVLLRKDSPEQADQWLVMFDLNTLTELNAIPINGDASFISIELLEDGQLAFMLGTSNFMLLNLNTGEEVLGQFTGVRPIVSPDVRLIVTGSPPYDYVTVWGVPGQ